MRQSEYLYIWMIHWLALIRATSPHLNVQAFRYNGGKDKSYTHITSCKVCGNQDSSVDD